MQFFGVKIESWQNDLVPPSVLRNVKSHSVEHRVQRYDAAKNDLVLCCKDEIKKSEAGEKAADASLGAENAWGSGIWSNLGDMPGMGGMGGMGGILCPPCSGIITLLTEISLSPQFRKSLLLNQSKAGLIFGLCH